MQVVNLVDAGGVGGMGWRGGPLCLAEQHCEPEGRESLAIVPVAHNAPSAAVPPGGSVRPPAADPPREVVRCVRFLLSEYIQCIVQ